MPEKNAEQSPIQRLAALLETRKIDYWLQPLADEFQGEYPAPCAQRLAWLTGFTGSAGLGLFSAKAEAALFVDGRYTLQAAQQVPAGTNVHLSSEFSFGDWAQTQTQPICVAYDPWLHTMAEIEKWHKAMPANVTLRPDVNAVDAVWHDRPAMPAEAISRHSEVLAGQSAAEKLADLREWMQENKVEGHFISAPDAVMWLLNLRGSDIDYNPVALCCAFVNADGEAHVYAAPRDMGAELQAYLQGIGASMHDIALLWQGESNPFSGVASCAIDTSDAPSALSDLAAAAGCKFVVKPSMVTHAKALKQPAELAAIRDAHMRDGLALCKFLHWFSQQESVNELQVVDVLENFRREDASYRGPSFPTIAGAGPNGAIVHYRADTQSNRDLQQGELLLLDSGGHYAGGTTDVTRTMVLGAPSDAHINYYTRVLKGHIAVSRAQFPKGVCGYQLDPLARQYLWEIGADYNHGTGHGVGAYLCVHEGPQSISKRATLVALEAGMVLSNEPGYYEEGAFGIRIENLIEIIAAEKVGEAVLASAPLTMAPYVASLIDAAQLSADERAWLNDYHAEVLAAMQRAGAEGALLAWIAQQTKAL